MESRSPGSSSAPHTQNDWELLSMSGSALGIPQPAKIDGGGDMVVEPSAEEWKPLEDERNEERDRPPKPSPEPHAHVDTPSAAVTEDLFAQKEELAEEKPARESMAESKRMSRSRKSTVIWCIGVAATTIGIVMLGYRWQLQCCRNQQLQVELSDKDEKLSDLTDQVNRLKEVLGGYQKSSAAKL